MWLIFVTCFFFFKQKTAYEMRISDWSSDVCSSDLNAYLPTGHQLKAWLFGGQSIPVRHALFDVEASGLATIADLFGEDRYFADADAFWAAQDAAIEARRAAIIERSEEHTSELQSLMRISYAVF